MQKFISDQPVTKNLRIGLWALLAFFIIFGGIVENRSAFLKKRMTDADDFFRAAWGVRADKDIYDLVDTQGWHYNYPPFFAIALAPLANPPPGDPDRAGMLPYAASIAIWYVLSVIALVFAIHWLAGALEENFSGPLSKKPPRYCRRWWMLRLIPVLVCLPSIGRTLSRGQVNTFILLLFCGIGICLAKKRHALAGVCIAVAASIKLYPAFLGIYALLRRDWRCVAGCFAGAFFCLVLVPVATLGPSRTMACYKKYVTVLVGPAITGGGDQSRAQELLNATGSDSQSFMVVIHNTLHPFQRPDQVAPWVRKAHWILSFLITAITLWFGRRARPADGIYNILFLGTLILAMVPISPVAHTHYFIFALPLVMGLIAYSWEQNGAPVLGKGYVILFAIHIITNVLSLPNSHAGLFFRSLGLSLYGTLILWVAGIVALKRRSETPEPQDMENLKPQPVSA